MSSDDFLQKCFFNTLCTTFTFNHKSRIKAKYLNVIITSEGMKKVTAIVDRAKCKPTECQHECMTYDPINRSGGEGFHLGESGKAEIAEEQVTEMHRISAKMCPFDAIKIVKLPEELEKEPLHRYGENQFRLYGLPTPLFGKVIGILGSNGIGKSTALNILSGVLKPNLGDYTREGSYEDLIDHFKGTEAQSFFEKLAKGEVKISYKPQQVDLIAKTQKGKVKDLLKSVDEKGEFDEIIKLLELERILDNEISKVSGGELQRIAIAACVLKKANLYVFDEPTSYLDIKQRLKISKFIREMADENTAILVVEHDLIILDYMTDLVHIVYGEPGGYGVISNPRTTKNAINIYLSGYLKEENMRFRDHEIKFETRPLGKMEGGQPLTKWIDIEKTQGNFHLKAEKGEIAMQDVIGILGENGIGKTTFVRILAEDLKADKGKVDPMITVSYKPQYIDTTSDELVMTFLQDAVKTYEKQLIIPLNISPLLSKQLNQLSGGELQRVAICLALSRDVDLFLLDEPSAYLDVEQRLIISKVIREVMEQRGKACLVIDHDLLFLDYLSKKLIVFEGIPAKEGNVKGPFKMEEGMNRFLEDLGITFRRDEESHRPRANKEGSFKDRDQKSKKKYYYS